jgi:hypothetical protein
MGLFPRPGADVRAYIVGACNAVGLVRERDAVWSFSAVDRFGGLASREACDAFDHVRALRLLVGRRRARKWVARVAREVRRARKRGRGWAHVR